MSAKNIYDKDTFLENVATYLFTHDKETIESLTFKELYSNIVSEYGNASMPKLSQARIYLKDELINELDINEDEPITSSVVYRLTEIYEYTDDFEYFLSKHRFKFFSEDIIPCIIQLPDKEIFDYLAKGVANNYKKRISHITSKILIVNHICTCIKKAHKDCVIAAIPDYNPCISLKVKRVRKDDNPVNYCTSICIFVMNTPKGKDFIRSFSKDKSFPDYV